MRKFTLALAATITVTFAIPAQARHHHYQRQQPRQVIQTWGYVVQKQPVVHHRKTARTHKSKSIDANGNSAFAKVHTANGLIATVAASAKEKFQGFIDAVEADLIPDLGVGYFVDAKVIKGNRITDIGCLSSGHMPGSKHHSGRACDFGQLRRNVTTDKFMYHVASIAHEHGLIDGCEWGRRHGERYTGPDCGHIEVPGETRTLMARSHHRRHARYASR